jgi:hypothetical protein
MARDAEKAKFWRGKMAEYEKSGLTAREFCAQADLREVQFYYWRRGLKEGSRKKTGFVELVRSGGADGGAGVSIRLDERVSVVLERGFDGETLKAALAAVGGMRGQ